MKNFSIHFTRVKVVIPMNRMLQKTAQRLQRTAQRHRKLLRLQTAHIRPECIRSKMKQIIENALHVCILWIFLMWHTVQCMGASKGVSLLERGHHIFANGMTQLYHGMFPSYKYQ